MREEGPEREAILLCRRPGCGSKPGCPKRRPVAVRRAMPKQRLEPRVMMLMSRPSLGIGVAPLKIIRVLTRLGHVRGGPQTHRHTPRVGWCVS